MWGQTWHLRGSCLTLAGIGPPLVQDVGMSGDLTAFLNARLDEDEAYGPRPLEPGEYPNVFEGHEPGAPKRVLREVEAKRKILGMHHPTQPHPEFGFTYPAAAKFCGWCGPGDNWQAEQEPDHYPFALWPCGHARQLAAVYSDHPDYREEWKP